MDRFVKTLIVDIGTDSIKFGPAGYNLPSNCIQTSDIYYNIINNEKNQSKSQNEYVSNSVHIDPFQYLSKSEYKIWKNIIHRTQYYDEEELRVLYIEPFHELGLNRKALASLLFEKFSIDYLSFQLHAALILYSCGRSTGLILESGNSVTEIVPIYEGFSIPNAAYKWNFSGRDLNDVLQKLIKSSFRDLYYEHNFKLSVIKDIKEKLCYIPMQGVQLLKKKKEPANYLLPDGNIITIPSNCFECPELLFNPVSINNSKTNLGLHNLTFNSIKQTDIDLRKSLCESIVLSGGTTLTTGFSERLSQELTKLFPSTQRLKVIPHENRRYLAWIGGSIIGSINGQSTSWKSRQDYHEFGFDRLFNRIDCAA